MLGFKKSTQNHIYNGISFIFWKSTFLFLLFKPNYKKVDFQKMKEIPL